MQNSQNPQNLAPQGLVMTATVSSSDFERKEKKDIAKITPGNHLGRLYGIVDLGTQHNSMFNKDSHRIALLFEFPHLMQDFYKRKQGEQPELKPTMIKIEESFSMHPKSNFRKLVESATGKRFNDKEAETFNVFDLLGKWFTCNVMHDPDKNDPSNVYERINFIQPYDERFQVQGVDYSGINDLMAYSISVHGFKGDAWKSLWTKFRTKIQSSREGQKWAAQGGTFEEVSYESDNSGAANQSNTYQGPQSAPQNNPMQSQPGQPMQNQPQGAPSQPMQQPPQSAPSTPGQQAPQKRFVIKTAPFDMKSWTDNNWTEEMMVQHGHAEWVEGVA